jgi:hypothetical protein
MAIIVFFIFYKSPEINRQKRPKRTKMRQNRYDISCFLGYATAANAYGKHQSFFDRLILKKFTKNLINLANSIKN